MNSESSRAATVRLSVSLDLKLANSLVTDWDPVDTD
jgi:hypothetical protein